MPTPAAPERTTHEAEVRAAADHDLVSELRANVRDLERALEAERAAKAASRNRITLLETILSGLLPMPLSDALVDAQAHQSDKEGVSGPFNWAHRVGRRLIYALEAKFQPEPVES